VRRPLKGNLRTLPGCLTVFVVMADRLQAVTAVAIKANINVFRMGLSPVIAKNPCGV
jgi:hypothetical protein